MAVSLYKVFSNAQIFLLFLLSLSYAKACYRIKRERSYMWNRCDRMANSSFVKILNEDGALDGRWLSASAGGGRYPSAQRRA